MKRLRLKGIKFVSFVQSERTFFDAYKNSPEYPGDLKPGECFLFISKMGNQMVFIFRELQVEWDGRPRTVLDTRRLRLDGGTWSVYMLQEYAKLVGLNIIGIRTMDSVIKEHESDRAARRQALKEVE